MLQNEGNDEFQKLHIKKKKHFLHITCDFATHI